MNWRELGRELQELPKNFDISGIHSSKELAEPLKSRFMEIVRQLDDKEIHSLKKNPGDPDIHSKDELLEVVGKKIEEVNECIMDAKSPKDDSTRKLDKILFKKSGECNHQKDFCCNLHRGHDLYRMRKVDTGYRRFDKRGVYVVREEDCRVVDDARFNKDGQTFLYLAESLYTAWEEMRRPNFHMANFVRMEPSHDLMLLDLTIPDCPSSLYKLIRAYIALACGMKVDEGSAHIWQYEFSSFIAYRLHNKIREGKTKLSGIRYHSTRRFEEDFNIDNSRISTAYVFMPHDNTSPKPGYCPKLAAKFKMTEAFSYFFLKVHLHKFVPVDNPNTSEYQHTIFAKLEEIMKAQPATPCSDLLKS